MENVRISVADASKILGINQQCLRILLQKKLIPVGTAIPNTRGTGYRYYIYLNKINDFLGNDGFEKLGNVLKGD